MKEIIKKRTIRPSSRAEKSTSYKIDTKRITSNDILIVEINHESESFHYTYKFNGSEIVNKKSISFRVKDFGTSIDITWSGAKPIGILTEKNIKLNKPSPKKNNKGIFDSNEQNSKFSFNPISNNETRILILGTIPGDESLKKEEYYSNSRNKFWRIISEISKIESPVNYEEKKDLLIKLKIGIWDIVHNAIRKGSLDNEIKNEEPNDLLKFIETHKNLKIIGFNGKKAETLYDKYFVRKNHLFYITLPSSSPANTSVKYETILKKWQEIFKI